MTAPISGAPERTARPAVRAQSLAQGTVGASLLSIERAHNGTGTWEAVHVQLSAVTLHDLIASDQAALFLGAPAVAFVLQTAAAGTDRYRTALRTLDTTVIALTERRLDHARARMQRGERPRPAEYDLLYGLTGLGAYLLRRAPHGDAVRHVLSYLVRLSEPLRDDGVQLPGWWTHLDPVGGSSFPGGHGNLGMAHGIAGPLALLSLAHHHGVVVDGHAEAIERICTWLDTFRQDDGGAWWPQWVTLSEQRDRTVAQPGPMRPSWCYGTPGLARAQQLAGIALGDAARQRMAEDALVDCLSDPAQLDQITDSGLCHGAAGLLHTAVRVAQDARRHELTARLPRLRELLLAQEPEGEEGLLRGSTGPELVAQAAASGGIPASGWDVCLLLA
ncbi:lanthionine synthetase C family protein [Streptomyces luteireticuli]|uniref:Lanthionine synthetase C family protein n=1 Tax=Streptomyces luteireticuli TaxID=173858 RepID=A0ABN0Y6K9_9ACTN